MKNIYKWLLIALGSLTWTITMFKSGLPRDFGLGFWGANGHDGIWHIALAETISRGNFTMPVFSGNGIQNYHLGFDLLMAFVHQITGISTVHLYFQILPLLTSVVLGILTFTFVKRWSASDSAALWGLFFTYFGGSLGFVLGKGESAFWSQQAVSTLINPPFSLSLVILLLGLLFLQALDKKENLLNLVIPTILLGILIEIKVYAGILALGSLFVVSALRILSYKKYDFIKVFIGSLTISLILFLNSKISTSNIVVWQPFWFLETMMGLSDRIGWERFYSAMSTYKSGHNLIKLLPAYMVAFFVFILGNMGTRFVFAASLFSGYKKIKQLGWEYFFMIAFMVGGVVAPMLFLQKGTPWNTIQFFYYSLFFAGICAAKVMSGTNQKYLATLVVLLTVPTTLITLKDVYVPARPPAMLPGDEVEALRYLSKLPQGVVLTYPFDQTLAKEAENNPPRPLYLYTSTAYVSAFSGHTTFLEDEVNLDITGYDWVSRKNEVEAWYKQKDQVKAREFLSVNGIKYIYWIKPQRAILGESNLGITNIFENKSAVVYRVD